MWHGRSLTHPLGCAASTGGLRDYRYRIYSREGDEFGAYATAAWNWTVGDVLELHSGRGRWRIVKILDLDDTDDSSGKYQAAFMVEPACAKLPNHGCDGARPGCGGAF
jgi:hypothetical protein